MVRPKYYVDAKSWGGTTAELWRYRELLGFLIWRDVVIKYKQAFLGIAWAILQPLCTMVVFVLLFGRVAKLPTDGIPHPIFYYSGLLLWTFFATALNASGNSLVSNVNMLTKVYFPRAALPVSAVLAGLLDYAIAWLILLGMMIVYDVAFSWQLLLVPVVMLPVVAVALGAGMILAALNVKYRDIKYTLPFITQLLLFVTPVIYPLSMVPERYRYWMAFNPLAGPIEALRAAVLGRAIDWGGLGISGVVSILLLGLGYTFFCRSERQFADQI
jgi:lipopolysaccharide transport system permease protein